MNPLGPTRTGSRGRAPFGNLQGGWQGDIMRLTYSSARAGSARPIRGAWSGLVARGLVIAAAATVVAAPASAAALLAEIPVPTGGPVAGKTLSAASDAVSVISRAEAQKIGIPADFPDVHPTYLRFDDGPVRFWI